MKKLFLILTPILLLISCKADTKSDKSNLAEVETKETSPKEMLAQAYQLFKEGDDKGSIELANTVLKIGREEKNDTLIGRALTSLCRNAQRKLDTTRLTELSDELVALTEKSGDQKWLMYRAHMNAEMWRLVGNMDKAELFYDESMKISYETGSMGMYTIDHFNKSFVSTAKGDFVESNNLIKKYYQLRADANKDPEDAYGLIALSYLLEQQKNYEGAHEVAVVTRRLFKEQNLFPEPPDEKPLLRIEAKVKEMLKKETLDTISFNSTEKTVSQLLEKYLK